MWGTEKGKQHIRPLINNWAKGKLTYLLICFLTVFISGCVTLYDPEASQIHHNSTITRVTPNHIVGQSFVSRRKNVNGVSLWLRPKSTSGALYVDIRYSPEDQKPLVREYLRLRDINTAGETQIRFSSLPDSPDKRYFLSMSMDEGDIEVLGRDEDIYPYGHAYINGQPTDKDIAFQLSYEYNPTSLLRDVWSLRTRVNILLPIGLSLLLPGLLLLEITGVGHQFDLGDKTALAVGLSLATIPLLMLWTTVMGLAWSVRAVWIAGGLGGILFITLFIKKETREKLNTKTRYGLIEDSNIFIIVIFIISLIVRLIMIRDLAAPAWVDSVHHAIITRSILQEGGYPTNYAPLLPTEIGRYHPGFHSVLATFIWLSGLDIPEAMLLFGQVLNAFIVFAAYSFTLTLTDNRTAGLFAALLAGLFTPMPAYYTSWGRYTQLSGLLVLPVGLKWIRYSLQSKSSWSSKSLGVITIAGLSILHYRVLLFFSLLVFAYWIGRNLPLIGDNKREWSEEMIKLITIAIGSAIVASPWLIPTVLELIIPKAQIFVQGQLNDFTKITWRYLKPAWGSQALVFGGLGLFLGMFKRKTFILTTILWVGLMFAMANTGPLRLPFPSFINSNSVEISLFMPISALGGYAFSQIIGVTKNTFPSQWHRVIQRAFLLGGIILAFGAAKHLLPILNPVTFLFRDADRPALSWIANNIPNEEKILINPTGWGYGLYTGNDGGFWIAPLTGRQTLPPPVLYGLGSRDYIEQINQLIQEVQAKNRDSQALWEVLAGNEINYVYIGARGGILSPEALSESPSFNQIYHKNGVWIYKVLPVDSLR